jgi:TetR/AcrR family transcriptional repressor of nem operon
MTTDTRTALIDNALSLVRRRGYSAFSYADLAQAVGIRKPSIHHHFPGKEDLGLALVTAYTEHVSLLLDRAAAEHSDPLSRLNAYADMYRLGIESQEGCLCGVLASEIAVLPPRLQAGVRQFFNLNLRWLEQILEQGRNEGSLNPRVIAHREARTVLATLQGALSLALSLEDPNVFEQAVAGLFERLSAVER